MVVPSDQPNPAGLPQRLERPVASSSELNILNPFVDPNIIHLAWDHDLPVWEIGSPSNQETLAMLAAYRPDLICVVCFPQILPQSLLDLPRFGCLNLHPSLLPAYRGPQPLFWIAYHDERITGTTLHMIDRGLDTGAIVSQARFDRVDGMSGRKLEHRCAAKGGQLLLAAVQQLQQSQSLATYPQPERGSSYFPAPTAADYLIPVHWPARRAFNFLRGAEDWPLAIELEGIRYSIREAVGYDANQQLGSPFVLDQDRLLVQFQPGVLEAKF